MLVAEVTQRRPQKQ